MSDAGHWLGEDELSSRGHVPLTVKHHRSALAAPPLLSPASGPPKFTRATRTHHTAPRSRLTPRRALSAHYTRHPHYTTPSTLTTPHPAPSLHHTAGLGSTTHRRSTGGTRQTYRAHQRAIRTDSQASPPTGKRRRRRPTKAAAEETGTGREPTSQGSPASVSGAG